MRLLIDAETGEMGEYLETNVIGLEPYDYRQAKAAHMRASRNRREAEMEYEQAIRDLAAAERKYRVELASEVLRQKNKIGATNAEVAAKGEEHVAEAREEYVIADGMRYAKLERLRGCDGDRQGIAQLVKWSQAASTGPWAE